MTSSPAVLTPHLLLFILILYIYTSTPYPCPGNLLCSDEEVLLLLLHLPSDTASGPDGISSRMLKSTAHTIAPVLTCIFNLSIQSGVFPSDWKLFHVVPIPKFNSPSSCSDFRPISLLSIVSKILVRHITSL